MNTQVSAPISIYTLGCFEIARDGVPLRFAFKAPRKPLALLKALLAGGKNGVSQTALCDIIWSKVEPSLRARALNITTFRLRALLGSKSALIVQDGRVALDADQCWVDAWQFEESLVQANDQAELLGALRLYRGVFLGDSDHPLALETRDRLSCKFIR